MHTKQITKEFELQVKGKYRNAVVELLKTHLMRLIRDKVRTKNNENARQECSFDRFKDLVVEYGNFLKKQLQSRYTSVV